MAYVDLICDAHLGQDTTGLQHTPGILMLPPCHDQSSLPWCLDCILLSVLVSELRHSCKMLLMEGVAFTSTGEPQSSLYCLSQAAV